MRCRLAVVLAIAVTFVMPPLAGQDILDTSPQRDSTVRVVPGPHYKAGWLHRLFFGDHYRDLWTHPLEVGILDLQAFAGGLRARCVGGGFQTRSLRFDGADGREFAFRSVDKDPGAKLAPELRRSFVADILQDQISSHHPVGALVVAPLLEAAGVLHVSPQLAVMPDDTKLGEFREVFAGMLGMMEERPADGPRGTAGFGDSRRIEGTPYVWEKIQESQQHRVDATAYLTARLMDILVGDWDRHYDQWKWARFPSGDSFMWRPIPRDRDQAFSRLDGFILSLARIYIPELVSYDQSYPSLGGLAWTARALDRRFLSELERPTWDSVAQELQTRLTDAVIDGAVRRLPPEIYEVTGPALARVLEHRRDQLPGAADQFYSLLAEYVDVHATDEEERAEIVRLDDERVEVLIFRGTDTADANLAGWADLSFRRTFSRRETREIRIYLHGGDDVAAVKGDVEHNILIRVVGGGGDDALMDSSTVGGASRAHFYDARGDNTFERNWATVVDRTRFRRPPREQAVPPRPPGACGDSTPEVPPRALADPMRDWGSRWLPSPWSRFQPDLGLFVGAGAVRFGYGFRKVPYSTRTDFRAGYAAGPGRFRIEFDADVRGLMGKLGAVINLRYSGIEIIRFHGFGNETPLTQPPDFYKVKLQETRVAPALIHRFSDRTELSFGPVFRYGKVTRGTGNIMDVVDPYGSDEGFGELGLETQFRLDTRDRPIAASRGLYLTAGGLLVPALLDVRTNFAWAQGEVATYLTAPIPLEPTLAVRLGGKKVWGEAPFHEKAYLGGANTLRAHSEQRFAGDAAVYGNAELRLALTKITLLLPGEFGIFGLADAGRVFATDETSHQWHTAAGGGIWLAFLDRDGTTSVAFANSSEQNSVYIRAGFMF